MRIQLNRNGRVFLLSAIAWLVFSTGYWLQATAECRISGNRDCGLGAKGPMWSLHGRVVDLSAIGLWGGVGLTTFGVPLLVFGLGLAIAAGLRASRRS